MELNMSEIQEIFKCTRCGYCCHGETTVSLDSEDQERMCNALGMKREDVADKYWRITGNIVQMKVQDGHCVFYADGCTVHDGRPWRCAEWPLHPSILEDMSNHQAISDSCPGMNREIGYARFCEVLRQILADAPKAHC
jgi:hypothetical protein